MKAILERTISDLSSLLPRLLELTPVVHRLADVMLDCFAKRGKVLIAGNGGSAADAMHFAEELVVRFQKNRKGLPAMALCDPTVLTCAANDYGYDRVFARQVEAYGNPGDVFVAMTTSGNSVNLLRAVEAARAQGVMTAAFLGKDGGAMRGLCDLEIVIPSTLTARIQEAHKILYHCLCEYVESRVD